MRSFDIASDRRILDALKSIEHLLTNENRKTPGQLSEFAVKAFQSVCGRCTSQAIIANISRHYRSGDRDTLEVVLKKFR
jgi:hypothetical protein